MKNFIVIANFACQDSCEDDLYTSQWLVGTADSIEGCLDAAEADLYQVAKDHYNCVLPEDEYDTPEELEEALKNHIDDYISEAWKRPVFNIETALEEAGAAEILSNDFCCDCTDQRQLVKYYIYSIATIEGGMN